MSTRTRIADEARRNAAFDPKPFRTLPLRLEFSDLRELEAIIVNKLLWPKFSSRFRKKEELAIRFGQIAALRNPIRHKRHIDEIAFKDGEAGVIWFERMLAKPEESLDGVDDAEERPPTAT